ncbi:hypothetical protein SPOG_02494 [Schizosaccharomyces cryophilus OY26]|uniref:Uncharacterized protein n=1 Tax=Schizosaccharomyces cryophilus (strain OY26 / ATCC MYA-4695 / CBS 11777 / NBRC 106824 / NRRL Y48691) TaxID=653667 RepID=S9VZY6_SCHCR|nr:uncharacterized protein SPOG_02494 [Schizosaccharomyces cryophilus OY26]EPY51320.1 hypothetical protein SPOG_02494 [Schizosaccharomyces cryophilus OY26]
MQVSPSKKTSPVVTGDLKNLAPALPTFWIAFPASQPLGCLRPRINRRITQIKQRAETEEAVFNLYQRWNPLSFSYRLIFTDAIRDDKRIFAWFFTKRFRSRKLLMKTTKSFADGYMYWTITSTEGRVVFDCNTTNLMEVKQIVWKPQDRKSKEGNAWKADLVLPLQKQRMSVAFLNGLEIKFNPQIFEFTTRFIKFRYLEAAIFAMALYVKIYNLNILHPSLVP